MYVRSYIPVGDLALCNNRHYGDQHENDETLGDNHHVFQLRLCLYTRITYGNGGMCEFFTLLIESKIINLFGRFIDSHTFKSMIARMRLLDCTLCIHT